MPIYFMSIRNFWRLGQPKSSLSQSLTVFEKNPFQFWQEICIWVVVIFLQLYLYGKKLILEFKLTRYLAGLPQIWHFPLLVLKISFCLSTA